MFTAPPAKLSLAGGFRTFSFFHGFGHGDFWFFKESLDFGWSFYWMLDFQFFMSFSKEKEEVD